MSGDQPQYFHLGEVRDYEVRSRKKGIQNKKLTENDAALIEQYISEKQAVNRIKRHRVLKINNTLVGWRTNFLNTEYSQLTLPLLYQAIQKADTEPCQTGKPLAQNTRHDYHIILKAFLLWMIENRLNLNLDEKKVRNIKGPAINTNTTHPDEILNPDEITAMISACKGDSGPRNRALIAVQYESATRIGELSRLTWRDVFFDEYGAKLLIHDSKEGKIRRARLTNAISARYLWAWRDNYPGTPEGDEPIFLSERGGSLSYYAIRKVFLNAAAGAGVEKKVKTHLFRKSRGTHLIEQGLPVSNVVELMWANQGTRMIETYIHMSPVEQDRVMLKHAGMISDEESKAQERRISGHICMICHTQNSPTSRYCNQCGVSLTDDAAQKERALQILVSDKQFMNTVFDEMSRRR